MRDSGEINPRRRTTTPWDWDGTEYRPTDKDRRRATIALAAFATLVVVTVAIAGPRADRIAAAEDSAARHNEIDKKSLATLHNNGIPDFVNLENLLKSQN